MQRLTMLAAAAVLASAANAYGAGLILNEFNAVGEGKLISSGDTTFGSKAGNGGNWIELVVTQDHLDITGWTFQWDNVDPDAGSVTFTNNALWTDLRSGTIITLREDDTGDPGSPVGHRASDTSFNPFGNDWWIEINVDDAPYMIKSGFKVDNDDWRGRIVDDAAVVQQGYVGEGAGAPWSGGGISSTEAGALGANPTAVNPLTGYRDVTFSSYGQPNLISPGVYQDFTSLRAAVVPEPGSMFLAAIAGCGAALWGVRAKQRQIRTVLAACA
ncbi:MAG: hypothetical protein AB7O59_13735 [Pirellulales bacterium]